jgi:hypothetical protein
LGVAGVTGVGGGIAGTPTGTVGTPIGAIGAPGGGVGVLTAMETNSIRSIIDQPQSNKSKLSQSSAFRNRTCTYLFCKVLLLCNLLHKISAMSARENYDYN